MFRQSLNFKTSERLQCKKRREVTSRAENSLKFKGQTKLTHEENFSMSAESGQYSVVGHTIRR